MIFTTGFGLAALACHVLAREMAPDARMESKYRSGAFMEQMMAQKEVQLDSTVELSEANLTEYRQLFLGSVKLARTTRSSIQRSMIQSNVSMALQLQFLATQTIRSAAIM
jgi:hypothetical protein